MTDKDNDRSQRIREEALARSSQARSHLGEETLSKINKVMRDMGKDPLAKAKMGLEKADKSRMHNALRDLMDE